MATTQVSDTWESGNPYEQYIGRWSRRVAPLFLSWLGIPAGRRWLDVGCGTGALTAAILKQCSPSSVAGVDPSAGFIETAKEQLAGGALFHLGSATDIPLECGCTDVTVSGLVLNFVPDQPGAVAEMARVTVRGGTIGAYVWDYADKMEMIRIFWDAAVELNADAAQLHEGARFPLCRPEALGESFTHSGLQNVAVTALDIATPFASFEEYWRPFLGGQGPAPAYAMSLDDVARAKLRDRIRQHMSVQADGSISLTARAWAVRATVPS
jgi:SAM-dependent methyltransferase